MKTAVIGLGKVAERIHLPACKLVPEINLAAASDTSSERREAMKSQFSIPNVYADSMEMLEKEKPELVMIGTPPESHKALCLAALKNGAHVLCEKPFVLSLDDADEVIAAAKQQNKRLAVNTQYRYMSTYQTAREQIKSGEFGRLYFIHCWQQMYHPPIFEGTESWRSSLKQSTLFEFGSHPLDLITTFFGEYPKDVYANIPRVVPEYDSDVFVQMTLRFSNDRLATLVLNRVSHAPEKYLEMRLDCEKASIRISLGGVARAGIELSRHKGHNRPAFRMSFVKGGEARVESGGGARILAVEKTPAFASATASNLRTFVNGDSTGGIGFDTIEHARNILRIIFAGYESAETGQVVKLDF
ncbi:MAG TPA: Gfo/Idh/MocA family oxidoreductase [Drouetiella sp.]